MPHQAGDKDLTISTIILCVIFVIVLCGILTIVIRTKIRKRKEQHDGVFDQTPVVVTSATHTAPSGYVTQLPPPGYQANVYAAPYPVQTTGNVTVQMPMPQSMPGAQPPMAGMQTHGVAYPMPQPGAGVANMNPPPYDMAVSGGPQGGYEKQSPYNPTYPH
ncbi:uncharacterized protein LOC115628810 isoform X8 [Scaptodrosophila lebanonensis]|uniref:Uncharacterized protein LOC115628810 isoform X8 n=1 Tax=Drosophila lebanonensis TaxID=7225 RepID=A0A6J2TZ60_DROLE|nr:uncharacterized protein LOC115628810 isoform X8 [Scaptodrosophila lebanonensis]